jgi:hypothetical protein
MKAGETKVPVAKILESYARLKNIWKVGPELGISGQTAHRIIKEHLGYLMKPQFTEDQKKAIKTYYETTPDAEFNLDILVHLTGKLKSDISDFASKSGLTRYGRPKRLDSRQKLSMNQIERIKRNGHPRGMLGKKHTLETLAIVSESSKRQWANMRLTQTGLMAPEARKKSNERLQKAKELMDPTRNYSRANAGKRPDLGEIHFRSSWEANYARYLNLLMKMKIVEWWDFEQETFWFETIRRGVRSYKPDFRVKYKNDPIVEYVEVKGWITAKDRTKWKRMKKYHPRIKLVVVGKKQYETIRNKWRSSIPTWEAPQKLKLRAA